MDERKPSKTPILVIGLLLVLAVIFFINPENFNKLDFLGQEVQQVPLKIGTNLWPGYEPFYLTRHWSLDKFNWPLPKHVNIPI